MKKNGYTPLIIIAILGVCGYFLVKSKSASVTEDGSKKVGKQQITINGYYGYEVTLPDGYFIESSKWPKNDNYLGKSIVKDLSNNELLTISYGTNGWASQTNHQNIDGVNFEVTNSPLTCDGRVGYPTDEIAPNSDNPNLERELTVEIIVGCEGKDKALQSKVIQELINSIKWSSGLKDVLSGKKPTLYIPNTKFGGE